jgi:hypothetical protein
MVLPNRTRHLGSDTDSVALPLADVVGQPPGGGGCAGVYREALWRALSRSFVTDLGMFVSVLKLEVKNKSK